MSMPISLDLDHITGRFLSIGAPFLKPVAEAFERMGKWLKMRVEKVDLLDQASSGFPVVAFYNNAVTLWIDEMQHGALRPDEMGVGDRLASAGLAFIGGLKTAPEIIADEGIIPRFLKVAGEGLQAIVASMDRFEKPFPAMFNPTRRTASDLFGEAALAVRALESSRSQVETFLKAQVLGAYKLFQEGQGSGSGASAGSAEPTQASLELPETLDRLARYIVGALLLLSALPELLISIWQTFDLFVRSRVIEEFGHFEEKVYGLRAMLLDTLFVRLRLMMQQVAILVDVAAQVIVEQASFWLDFAQLLTVRLLVDFDNIGTDLMRYLRDVVLWLQDRLLNRFNDFLYFDLTPLIEIMLGPLASVILETVGIPHVTVLDLLQGTGSAVLKAFIDAAGRAASLIPLTELAELPERLAALGQVVDILGRPIGIPLSSKLRTIRPGNFPNVADQLLKSKLAADVEQSLSNLAATVPKRIEDSLDAAAYILQRTSLRFEKMAADTAHAGSVTEFSAIVGRAVDEANRVFGPEADALRKSVAEHEPGQAALSFEKWLVDGGFFTIGSVLDSYIFEILEMLRQRQEKGEDTTALITKTSPRILAQKAALGRARMQELTFDARGQNTDDALVAKLAAAFKTAVQGAYRSGVNVIQTAAEAGA